MSPAGMSTILLLAALFCHREAWTPPTPTPDDSTRINDNVKRLMSMPVNRALAFILKNLSIVHILAEIFAMAPFDTSRKSALFMNLCPSMPAAPFGNANSTPLVYPSHHLSTVQIISLGLVIFGGLTRASCHRRLGRMFTWETAIVKDHKLITSGPYSIVRHPSYTGLISDCFGYCLFLLSRGGYARECFMGESLGIHSMLDIRSMFGALYVLATITFCLEVNSWLVRRSFVEDKMLQKKFGEEWDVWARKVRWNIFPYVL